MHGNTGWRYLTLHVHMESTGSVHWILDNEQHLRHLFAEGQLQYQQHREKH